MPDAGATGRPVRGVVGRGDLAHAMDLMRAAFPEGELGTDELAEAMARLCGFGWKPPEPVVEERRMPGPKGETAPPPPVAPPPPPPGEPVKFWCLADVEELSPAEARRRVQRPVELEQARLLERKDLTWSGSAPAGPPLIPWRRLWPFLKGVLGRRTPGRDPDIPRTLKRIAAARPMARLPRRLRRGWHPEVHVWLDRRPGMAPFWSDMDGLLGLLRRMRGTAGLQVSMLEPDGDGEGSGTGFNAHAFPVTWASLERERERAERWRRDQDAGKAGPGSPFGLRLPDSSSVVFVLGDLGQYEGDESRAPWLRLGRLLRRREIVPRALCPCPRTRWDAAMARVWEAVEWDRSSRMPSDGCGQLPTRREPDEERAWREQATGRLLGLTAPAINVEWGLLRELRGLLPSDVADVGTEHDLMWDHEAAGGLGFSIDPHRVRDLRGAVARWDTAQLHAVVRLMRRHHAHCAGVIGRMELLALAQTLPPDRWQGLVDAGIVAPDELAQAGRFIDALARTVTEPGTGEASEGLKRFGGRDADRVSPERMGVAPGVGHQVLYGLNHLSDAELPSWVDPRNLAFMDPGKGEGVRRPIGFRDGIVLGDRGVFHITDFWTASKACHVRVKDAEGRVLGPVRRVEWEPGGVLEPAALAGASRVELVSEGRTLALETLTLPYWAERMWMEPMGLRATTQAGEGGVVFEWAGEELGTMPGGKAMRRIEGRWKALSKPSWADDVTVDRWGVVAGFNLAGVRFVLRWIPAGGFWMGSPGDERGRFSDEGPRHWVELSRGYWMGETPVTQEQWRKVVELGASGRGLWGRNTGEEVRLKPKPSQFKGLRNPVEQVSWDDCQEWLKLLTRQMNGGLEFRLPTEAQWERACRAGTDGAFGDGSACTMPDGLDPALDRMGWFGQNSKGSTHPVGTKEPNLWGLHDMHGNVWEWCADGRRSYGVAGAIDPVGPREIASRVVRGGSWGFLAGGCRSASRGDGPRDFRWFNLGLRLLAGQEPGAAEPQAAERPGAPEGRSRAGAGGPSAPEAPRA